jgi:hypothetical protein
MILRFLSEILLIGLFHFGFGTLLYYWRIKGNSCIVASDWVVVALPLAVAFAGYMWGYLRSAFLAEHMILRVVLAVILALFFAVISFSTTMLFVLNKFGS